MPNLANLIFYDTNLPSLQVWWIFVKVSVFSSIMCKQFYDSNHVFPSSTFELKAAGNLCISNSSTLVFLLYSQCLLHFLYEQIYAFDEPLGRIDIHDEP